MSTLYVFNDNGTLYWGSYGNCSSKAIFYQWIMRRTPMRPNRWCGSRGCWVKFEPFVGQFGEKQFIIDYYDTNNQLGKLFVLRRYDCNVIIMSSAPCEQQFTVLERRQAQSLIGCFANRLMEYWGSYLIPMSKGNNKLKQAA